MLQFLLNFKVFASQKICICCLLLFLNGVLLGSYASLRLVKILLSQPFEYGDSSRQMFEVEFSALRHLFKHRPGNKR